MRVAGPPHARLTVLTFCSTLAEDTNRFHAFVHVGLPGRLDLTQLLQALVDLRPDRQRKKKMDGGRGNRKAREV